VRRAAWSVGCIVIGTLVSWRSALFASRFTQSHPWPPAHDHWRRCWDIEHCSVSWPGYAAIVLFIFAPVVTWALVGFAQARTLTVSRAFVTGSVLTLGTVLFYLCFYGAVWP
jgi:hypothetical protein